MKLHYRIPGTIASPLCRTGGLNHEVTDDSSEVTCGRCKTKLKRHSPTKNVTVNANKTTIESVIGRLHYQATFGMVEVRLNVVMLANDEIYYEGIWDMPAVRDGKLKAISFLTRQHMTLEDAIADALNQIRKYNHAAVNQ